MADTAATEVQVAMRHTSPQLTGRRLILTDKSVDELEDESVIIEELERVFETHWQNVKDIRFLTDYYKGIHPAIRDRVKRVRPDVDNKVTINYAYAFTRDITGYFLGKSVRYVQRGSAKDDTTGDMGADVGGDKRKQMEHLNHVFDIENKASIDWDIALDMSIVGTAYRGVFSEENPRNGTHLHLTKLDPETTFVVYSSGNMQIPMYAVTYWTNNVKMMSEKKTFIRVYTQTRMFDFEVDGDMVDTPTLSVGSEVVLKNKVEIGFNGSLPIIEYRNNAFRIGDWEVAIPIMDGIDTLASDGVNDIEQFVQSVLIAIGMEFTPETQEILNNVGVLNIPQLPAGMEYPPELRYISPQLDAASGMAIRDYLEACLRVIVGVPDRKTRGGGGGDTGDAVFLRDGWQDIDLVAANKENSFIQSEREALNVALYILDTHDELDGTLETGDVEIKFNRNKTSNLQSKVQSLATLWELLDPADAMDICDLTTNIEDVIIRAERYQSKKMEMAQSLAQSAMGGGQSKAPDSAQGEQNQSKNNSNEDDGEDA